MIKTMHCETRPSFYTIIMTAAVSMFIAGCTVPTTNIGNVGRWEIPMSSPKEFNGAPDTMPKISGHSYVVKGKRYHVQPVAIGHRETGLASWYGRKFHGRLTANQETYDMYQLTAAHKSLPLPAYIKVFNHNNGKSVTVRVNDRGPFVEGRIIDLSYAAAKEIDMVEAGLAPVTIEVINPKIPNPTAKVSNSPNKHYRGYIQVGAYKEIANASRVVGLLKRQNLIPRLEQTSYRSATNLHHVRLGPFDTRQELDAVGRQLARSGFKDYRVFYRF